jgi:arsenate reductase
MSEKPKVLVICTGNTMRSQMAEGMLRHDLGDKIEVYSAGTHPSSTVHPLTVAAMEDIGIDISQHTPKGIATFRDARMDLVITVCDSAHQICPSFPNAKRMVHRGYPDPVAPQVGMSIEETFAALRDQMRIDLLEIVTREVKL